MTPVRFSASERYLITVNEDAMAQAWDLGTGNLVRAWPHLPEAPGLAGSAPEDLVVEVAFNRQVRLTPLPQGPQVLRSLDFFEVERSTFSHSSRWFAVASHSGYARVWDTDDWHVAATLGGFLLGLDSVAFSPDDRRLATGTGQFPGEALRLWDTETWLDVLTLECEGSHFVSAEFSADDRCLGLMDSNGVLNLWWAPTWEEIEAAERANESPNP
jgi:WD40 repeat protein